jgi:hypothetical protein
MECSIELLEMSVQGRMGRLWLNRPDYCTYGGV